jgi:hypothetical protein
VSEAGTKVVGFENAAGDLVGCIREQMQLDDDMMVALLTAQATNQARKKLATQLRRHGLIDDDQLALAFYQWPLKEA